MSECLSGQDLPANERLSSQGSVTNTQSVDSLLGINQNSIEATEIMFAAWKPLHSFLLMCVLCRTRLE